MNNLNQIVTPEVVATSKLEQICKAKDQINREGISTCELNIYDDYIALKIVSPGELKQVKEFKYTVEEMNEAKDLLNKYVTVSPECPSAKEGTLLMEQIA